MVYHAQCSYYGALLEAGVRIYLYPAPYVLHSKHFSIDDDVAVLGSSNMDLRSFALNYEVSMMLRGGDVVSRMRKVEDAYRPQSRELTQEEWAERPWRSRVRRQRHAADVSPAVIRVGARAISRAFCKALVWSPEQALWGDTMNTVAMVGLSHRTAPLALLERVAVRANRRGDVLAAVRAAGFSEAVLLVTCSRTEIYAAGPHAQPDRLVDVLAEQAGSAYGTVRRTAELRVGQAAVAHLFRVTSGLESRVVGEPEIRSQVRAAFREACAAGATGGTLGELFAGAVRVATRVHQETALGSTSRSLARRAVDLAVTGTADAGPTVLVVGSGRMASAAVSHLRCLGHRPTVVARDQRRAVQLGGASRARPLSELDATDGRGRRGPLRDLGV